jgi:hypothetical protein
VTGITGRASRPSRYATVVRPACQLRHLVPVRPPPAEPGDGAGRPREASGNTGSANSRTQDAEFIAFRVLKDYPGLPPLSNVRSCGSVEPSNLRLSSKFQPRRPLSPGQSSERRRRPISSAGVAEILFIKSDLPRWPPGSPIPRESWPRRGHPSSVRGGGVESRFGGSGGAFIGPVGVHPLSEMTSRICFMLKTSYS